MEFEGGFVLVGADEFDEAEVLVGCEDFGGLRGGFAVGGDDAVGAEVVVVWEVAVVAAVGEEFELAGGGGEVGKIEGEDGAWVASGSALGVDGLVEDGEGFDLSVEGAVAVLGIAGDPDVEGGGLDRAFVFLAREDVAIDGEGEFLSVVVSNDLMPVVLPIGRNLCGDGAPGAIEDEEFQIAAVVDFESP